MGALKQVFRTAAAVTAGIIAWGVLVERHLYTIRRAALPLRQTGPRPLRVLHLSDLHLTPWQHRKVAWVRSLVELNPDLVVLTGDLLGHSNSITALRSALEPFANRGIPGVFVHGSNDYYGPILKNPLKYLTPPNRKSTRIPDIDTRELTRMLVEDVGFTDLNNGAARLDVAGQSVVFFGVNDPHIRYDRPGEMHSALESLKPAPNEIRFGLVHAPYQESLDELLRGRADIIFAGHTHGGQVRIPGIGSLTSNCDLPTSQGRGVSVAFDDDHAAFLNVSAGLGTSLYAPIRVACRPEVSLVTVLPSGALLTQ